MTENVFRPVYRPLTPDEQAQINAVKDAAQVLYDLLHEYPNPSREVSLAKTYLETSIMWAIKGLTSAPATVEVIIYEKPVLDETDIVTQLLIDDFDQFHNNAQVRSNYAGQCRTAMARAGITKNLPVYVYYDVARQNWVIMCVHKSQDDRTTNS